TLLSGLRDYSRRITAIVSVADDGGSSGRLRHDFDMLPPGDIRNCLVALSDVTPAMAKLLQYRFPEGEFSGHSFGNLFIAVLAIIIGDFGGAIREMNRILSVRGQVLPATLDKISLVATHPDNSKTTGQQWIAKCGKPIESLELRPAPGDPPLDVLAAVAGADLITLGPGSLFTSVLPNLLDAKMIEAINRSPARVVYIANTAGQVGETQGFSASAHIRMLKKHAPALKIDMALVNNRSAGPDRLAAMATKGVTPTECDVREILASGIEPIARDVVNLDNPVRHDPAKTARVLMEIVAGFSAHL
ncbi:MAG: uridine diphosphate-N-acetylglucosamine-binding protein YvcK, partial [Planctomycetota bacterium]|nr:uridine diphosphate-N-acetylglucosamine-binding protein YvcK [Planctomycetota bacterium]